MKKLALLLIATSAILVGCIDDDDDVVIVEEPPGDEVPPPPPVIELTANITGFGPYIYLSGVGRVLIDSPDSFTAEIDIRNDIPGAVRPWHVHFGTCPGGVIVGPPDLYRPLMITGNGTDAVTTVVPLPLDLDFAYSINMHVSLSDPTIIACGELF